MQRSSYLCLALVAGLLAAGCSDQRPTEPAAARKGTPIVKALATSDGCELIAGTAQFTTFEFTSPTTAMSTGSVSGDLTGTFSVQYFNIHKNGDGSGAMNSSHTITTSAGSITTADDIILLPDTNPAFIRPVSHLNIVSGTGSYEGATGLIRVQGEVDLATLVGSLDYTGQICVP